ncbi:MAG: hypothetical protein ISS34_01685 [Candidatus Omnitrophica bacterium]|nr:hypothetical protein [Candidatus Omnitrophota bacterium]
MLKTVTAFFISIFVLGAVSASAEDLSIQELKGISIGMKRAHLIDNWGYPAKRETKRKKDTWFYLYENTPYPTDGVVVFFYKGEVENWKVVDNIYEEMKIWGKSPGAPL